MKDFLIAVIFVVFVFAVVVMALAGTKDSKKNDFEKDGNR